ncbi:hypothetical protein B296_00012005, partial [Ensete ventricosum]
VMGLLDQLWDDTVAGPRPETVLGRLRKHSSFGLRSNTTTKVDGCGGDEAEGAAAIGVGGSRGSEGGGEEVDVRVTRSIMMKRPAGCPSPGNATPRYGRLSYDCNTKMGDDRSSSNNAVGDVTRRCYRSVPHLHRHYPTNAKGGMICLHPLDSRSPLELKEPKKIDVVINLRLRSRQLSLLALAMGI